MSDIENDAVYCFICCTSEDKLSRVIECVSCGRSVHFKCKKMFGNAVTKARKKAFLCSVECTDMYMRVNRQHECTADSEVMNELRKITNAVIKVQAEGEQTRNSLEKAASRIKDLIASNKQIEASQSFLSEKFEGLRVSLDMFKTDVNDLKTENATIKSELAQMQHKHQELEIVVGKLEADMDRANRESLSKNAVLLGLPTTEN